MAGKDFSRIFKAWLDCFTACGSLDLLKPILPSLREGDTHIYKDWIKSSLSLFVESIEHEEANELTNSSSSPKGVSRTILQVCSRCIEVVLDPSSDISIKMLFFDDICIPTLKRCHSRGLQELCTSRDLSQVIQIHKGSGGDTLIKQLVDILSQNSTAISLLQQEECMTEEMEQVLLRVLCAYTIIESIYDRYNCDR